MRDIVNRIAVDGRTVTFILQNLRSVDPHFDGWYSPFVEEMKTDELLVFFKNLRNLSEKEGEDGIRGVQYRPSPGSRIEMSPEGLRITYHDSEGNQETLLYSRPTNAIATFIGDQEGGSGFVVKDPDGTERKEYVYLPPTAADVSLIFSAPPGSHKGELVTGLPQGSWTPGKGCMIARFPEEDERCRNGECSAASSRSRR